MRDAGSGKIGKMTDQSSEFEERNILTESRAGSDRGRPSLSRKQKKKKKKKYTKQESKMGRWDSSDDEDGEVKSKQKTKRARAETAGKAEPAAPAFPLHTVNDIPAQSSSSSAVESATAAAVTKATAATAITAITSTTVTTVTTATNATNSIAVFAAAATTTSVTTATTTAAAVDDDPVLAAHNPLFYGCRSVDEYIRLNFIDQGTYGVVFKARCRSTGQIYALKQVKIGRESAKVGFPITALREANIMLALRHPNIVRVREMVVGNTIDKVRDYRDFGSVTTFRLLTRRLATGVYGYGIRRPGFEGLHGRGEKAVFDGRGEAAFAAVPQRRRPHARALVHPPRLENIQLAVPKRGPVRVRFRPRTAVRQPYQALHLRGGDAVVPCTGAAVWLAGVFHTTRHVVGRVHFRRDADGAAAAAGGRGTRPNRQDVAPIGGTVGGHLARGHVAPRRGQNQLEAVQQPVHTMLLRRSHSVPYLLPHPSIYPFSPYSAGANCATFSPPRPSQAACA